LTGERFAASFARSGMRSRLYERTLALRGTALALATFASAQSALAGDAAGVWLHDDGQSKVRVAPCGSALCSVIVWLKDVWLKDTSGPAKVGQRVFYDMVSAGENSWTGKAFEPSSGREYAGKMTLAGDTLTTAGCVLGRLDLQIDRLVAFEIARATPPASWPALFRPSTQLPLTNFRS
jgi:uncharacterized protein (DUF2147 family)